jgi:hypothetical protein
MTDLSGFERRRLRIAIQGVISQWAAQGCMPSQRGIRDPVKAILQILADETGLDLS